MRNAARLLTIATLTLTLLGGGPAAWACGFLVAENGAIRLDTFTAASILDADGTAHYVTAFSFNGSPESFGAVIPLPDVPTEVERAPDWFLQRLGIETSPPVALEAAALSDEAGAAREAEVIATYEVDALDITVLSGGGAEVLAWADSNGYDLGVADGDIEDRSDAVEMLDFYGDRSPYFAALKFDNERAAEQGLSSGDGTPVRFSFTEQEEAWIPVAVLGFDKPATEIVVADLYLLTAGRPTILGGQVAGTEVVFQRDYGPDDALVRDLVDDERATWVPTDFTLTRIDVRTEQRLLDFDLAAKVGEVPQASSAFGVTFAADPADDPAGGPSDGPVSDPAQDPAQDPSQEPIVPLAAPTDGSAAPAVIVVLALVVVVLGAALLTARRRRVR